MNLAPATATTSFNRHPPRLAMIAMRIATARPAGRAPAGQSSPRAPRRADRAARNDAPIHPRLYETESRNLNLAACRPRAPFAYGVLPTPPTSAPKTMADYRNGPAIFQQDCRLGDDTTVENGFTLSMQCQGVKSVLTWTFEKPTSSTSRS